jgi:flagellar FliL protein
MSNETQAPAAAPKKKSRRTLMIAVAGLVLLGGGGGAAYWKFAPGYAAAAEGKAKSKSKAKHGDAAAEAEHEEDEAEEGPTGIVALEPFVVNLADPGATRFLRISLSLVVGEEHAKELAEKEVERMQLRSSILELLALQTSGTLVTPEGKTELKKAIAKRVGETVHGLHVVDVLLSEFVVQF